MKTSPFGEAGIDNELLVQDSNEQIALMHNGRICCTVRGEDHRVVFQGVHMLMGSDRGAKWKPTDTRASKMIFIGKGLPRDLLESGLATCVYTGQKTQAIH